MIAEAVQSVTGKQDRNAEVRIELDIPRTSEHGDYATKHSG
jgi:arginyl-tRNA synthetase